MSPKDFEIQESPTTTLDAGDGLSSVRHTIYEKDQSDFFKSLNRQLQDVHGILPKIDLTGFEQDAPDHSDGLTRVWHDIQKMFGHHETLNDKLTEKAVEDMKNSKDPKEQANYKKYQEEEKALAKYEEEKRQWGMLETLNPPPFPEKPNCPMHDEIEKRVHKTEDKITQEVRSHMTPEELKQLDKDMKAYKNASEKIFEDGGFRPNPEPSELIRKYWHHIAAATELYANL